MKMICFKKKTYYNTKWIQKFKNSKMNSKIPPSIFYDYDFLKSDTKLTQVKNCKLSIEELIKKKTIINTLIYFHPF